MGNTPSTIGGHDSPFQAYKHYSDGNVTAGVVDVSGGDITFTGTSGVMLRSNDGGNITVDLVGDPATATGTLHTLNPGSFFEARVRKIYQSGTDAGQGIRAIL